ncbi:unnamed protein product, partial [Urochloa humidicola]
LQGILQFQRISLLISRFLPATRFLPAIAVVIEATFWCSISSCHCGVLIPASNSRNMCSDSPAFSRTTHRVVVYAPSVSTDRSIRYLFCLEGQLEKNYRETSVRI